MSIYALITAAIAGGLVEVLLGWFFVRIKPTTKHAFAVIIAVFIFAYISVNISENTLQSKIPEPTIKDSNVVQVEGDVTGGQIYQAGNDIVIENAVSTADQKENQFFEEDAIKILYGSEEPLIYEDGEYIVSDDN